MNKRDVVLSLLDPARPPEYVPAAFFLHFAPEFHAGQAAVAKHLEFFRTTGMDLVKVQYEHPFPRRDIRRPHDWTGIPPLGRGFFAEPLAVVQGLVQAAKREALVVATLYSPFMCAGQVGGDDVRDRHLREDPEAVAKGLEIVTEDLACFVRGCIEAGVDGFYASTQGGEAARFADAAIFAEHVRPFDLRLWQECLRGTAFNVLHVCDYHLPYDTLAPFLDYPGDVVSCPLAVGGKPLPPRQAADILGRPVMGGMDRHGVIVHGTDAEIRQAATGVLSGAPGRFMLGADCTLPPDTSWDRIRTAIDAAHSTRPQGRS